jgi:hypothetical protein
MRPHIAYALYKAFPHAYSNPHFKILDSIVGAKSYFYVLRSYIRFGWYRGCRVLFSYFALSDPFWEVPMASGTIFMICAFRLVSGGTEGVDSHFHVFRSRTYFRRYRGYRVPFSCFALPNSFCMVPKGIGFGIHVLHSQPHFLRYRGRRVLFSCFALPDSISIVMRMFPGLVFGDTEGAWPLFLFCAPGLIFGGT